MSGRQRFGGMNTSSAAARGIYAPHDSILLPPSCLVFEPREMSQAPFHKSTVLIDALAGVLAGVGLVVAGVISLFVHIPSPL